MKWQAHVLTKIAVLENQVCGAPFGYKTISQGHDRGKDYPKT